jgi:hypothetical protein
MHPDVYKILDYLYYNRQHGTFLMYNLFMIYQFSYAACFDHNFGHHQALNERCVYFRSDDDQNCGRNVYHS